MTFGERIKSLRTESKMTMRELAKEVGVSSSYIHHIETKGVIPNPERVKQLAEALDCNPYESEAFLDSATHDLIENAKAKIYHKYGVTP